MGVRTYLVPGSYTGKLKISKTQTFKENLVDYGNENFLINLVLLFALTSCTNTSELETGEMKPLHMLKKAFEGKNIQKHLLMLKFVKSEQIDEANIPVLFVKLKSG